MKMNESAVLFEVSNGIATLTLNQGTRMNPLTAALRQGLLDGLQRIVADASIRALVLTATGKGFCTGADLAMLAQNGSIEPGAPSLGEQIHDLMEKTGNPIIESLRNLPVPVVCAVNGAAAGAGVGLALAADVVIAARSAYFYLPFVPALGLVPDLGISWFLPRLVGRARASGLTLLGERVSAERAAGMGLVWACVDDENLMAEGLGIAARLAALPAGAAQETRALFQASEQQSLSNQLVYERTRQRELIDSESFAEGLRALAAKRAPVFPGR